MSEHMKRLKLYIETSVWNFLLADDAPTKRAITEQFFRQIEVEPHYDLFISTFVMEELERTGDPTRRQALLDAVAQRTPELLDEQPEIESLADQFVAGGVVPPKYHGDAIHLAYAYVHNMDVLVSWNQHHIVKLKTKRLATAIAQIEGYKPIEILTPEEVLDND